jgi:hypothetical protein
VLWTALAVPLGAREPPAAAAARVEQAPGLDGRLDDPAWREARTISDFRQKDPSHGEAATESTRVRVVYDETHLYIGAELADREVSLVRATELRRDNEMGGDDTFAVLLDPYHDHRNAFLFRVNARGTRYDALVRNESGTPDADWDEEWHAAAVLTDSGWSVEVAIPFKILRFRNGEPAWGINFERIIKRKNEAVYWTAWDRNFAFTHVSQAGHLSGLNGIRQATRVRLRPYVMSGAERLDAANPPEPSRGVAEIGIDDLRVAVTSHLTADLTVNPDFAQSEADAQRVNLTRFSLFFPERRQFFIEGADSLKMGADTMGFGTRLLELVYTRTIGLSPAGEPISILGGGKLTGKVGAVDLGVLDVQTRSAESAPAENFLVARARKELLGRSYVGALFTNREGGDAANRVAGLDAHVVVRDHLNISSLAAVSSDTSVSGGRWAIQAGASWESDLVDAAANAVDIDDGFRPGIGFVRGADRVLAGRFGLKPRPRGGIVRQLEFMSSSVYYDERDSAALTGESTLSFAMDFQSGERFFTKIDHQVERLAEPFEIYNGVVLSPGRYEFNRVEASIATFNGRRLSGRAEVNTGRFYTGRQESYEFGADYKPGKNFSVECEYEINDVRLVEGDFTTHLLGLKTNISFSPTLLSSTYLQYNSAGGLTALQVRLNYIFRTIDNLYVVFNQTLYGAGTNGGQSNRSLVVKMTYSLQR